MADIPYPRGVRDLMPNEALFRNEVIRKIEETFQSFGFLTIDTPAFESMKILNAKEGGGENTKLLYEMKFENLALRFDFTMSLARFMAMNQSLPLPFRRYVVGKSWRREEPQKLRYREFTQADIDIVGAAGPNPEAEVIAVPGFLMEKLGLHYRILINDRRFVDSMLEKLGVAEEKRLGVMRTIDKLDKVGRDGVIELLGKEGLDRDTIAKLDQMINFKGTNSEKIDYLATLIKENESIKNMKRVLELLEKYGIKGEIVIDLSLMRGMDYYTGIIFEFKVLDKDVHSTVCAGGRYDNLVGLFSKKSLPAVGNSIGVDRLLDIMEFSSSGRYLYATIFVANITETNYDYALGVANQIRNAGLGVQLNSVKRNISNQLAFANSLKFEFVVIVGDGEEKVGKVKLRNLVTGVESLMSVKEAIDTIKKG